MIGVAARGVRYKNILKPKNRVDESVHFTAAVGKAGTNGDGASRVRPSRSSIQPSMVAEATGENWSCGTGIKND